MGHFWIIPRLAFVNSVMFLPKWPTYDLRYLVCIQHLSHWLYMHFLIWATLGSHPFCSEEASSAAPLPVVVQILMLSGNSHKMARTSEFACTVRRGTAFTQNESGTWHKGKVPGFAAPFYVNVHEMVRTPCWFVFVMTFMFYVCFQMCLGSRKNDQLDFMSACF